jgi:hypothetical protein
MTTQTTSGELCSVCKIPVKGGFEVFSYSRLGDPRIVVDRTQDNDFIVCDWCNTTVCNRCAVYRETGYCNDCYRKASVMIDDVQEVTRAETPMTMNQEPPQIIYEEPKGSELTAHDRAMLLFKLTEDRKVDLADFQGRIDAFCEKLRQIANDFEHFMSSTDHAIMEVMRATTKEEATEAATQFDRQTN